MTDRYNALIVVLDNTIRSDDAEPIINAIRMIKGVFSVEPNVTDMQTHIATEKAKREIYEKIKQAFD